MRRRSFLIALVLSAFIIAPCRAQDTYQEEADRLATLLNWQQGSTVAEVGAGGGQLTSAAAKFVGTAGRVYTTELDHNKLAHLEVLAAKEKNITAMPAGEAQTNLPPECCDSIFMRLVYHHLTKPTQMDASLYRSLKPGGMLAVIDQEPRPGSQMVEGVLANRGGHGVPEKILIGELTAVGFQMVKSLSDWPDSHYCVIFRKPSL